MSSAALAKRAEIAGKIEVMQREMRTLVATIGHINATIRTFDPSIDLEDIIPKLPPRFQAFKGEVSRIVLDALRESKTPLPVFDHHVSVAAGRGISTDDKPFMIILRRRVDACLRICANAAREIKPTLGQPHALGNRALIAVGGPFHQDRESRLFRAASVTL